MERAHIQAILEIGVGRGLTLWFSCNFNYWAWRSHGKLFNADNLKLTGDVAFAT